VNVQLRLAASGYLLVVPLHLQNFMLVSKADKWMPRDRICSPPPQMTMDKEKERTPPVLQSNNISDINFFLFHPPLRRKQKKKKGSRRGSKAFMTCNEKALFDVYVVVAQLEC
jgi:hypothetical protein